MPAARFTMMVMLVHATHALALDGEGNNATSNRECSLGADTQSSASMLQFGNPESKKSAGGSCTPSPSQTLSSDAIGSLLQVKIVDKANECDQCLTMNQFAKHDIWRNERECKRLKETTECREPCVFRFGQEYIDDFFNHSCHDTCLRCINEKELELGNLSNKLAECTRFLESDCFDRCKNHGDEMLDATFDRISVYCNFVDFADGTGCTDLPTDWMVENRTECSTYTWMYANRCNAPLETNPYRDDWVTNKYCQKSCWEHGNGYEGDNCGQASDMWEVFIPGQECSSHSGKTDLGDHSLQVCKDVASAEDQCGMFLVSNGGNNCVCYDTCSATTFSSQGNTVYKRQTSPIGYACERNKRYVLAKTCFKDKCPLKGIATLQDCANECTRQDGCQVFVYYSYGNCYLKSNSNKTREAYPIYETVSCKATCATYRCPSDYAIKNSASTTLSQSNCCQMSPIGYACERNKTYVLAKTCFKDKCPLEGIATLQDCANECTKQDGCQVFVYHSSYQGHCYLKSNSNKTREDDRNLGTVSCKATCATYACPSNYAIKNSASTTLSQSNCCQMPTLFEAISVPKTDPECEEYTTGACEKDADCQAIVNYYQDATCSAGRCRCTRYPSECAQKTSLSETTLCIKKSGKKPYGTALSFVFR